MHRERSRPPKPREVVEVTDEDAGLVGWIVVDRVREGMTAGGIRRARYAREDEALEEAKILARRMTLKLAAAGLPSGGAKTVIMDHEGLDVEAAYRALGRRIDELDPPYLCGPDVGTSEEELEHVRAETDRVNPGANEPARRTAEGVLKGIEAVFEAIEDPVGLSGSRVHVQGFGAVGEVLAKRLREAGAEVRVADVDPAARARARSMEFELIDADDVLSEPCTLLSPCAAGGVITPDIAAQLPARAVCGSANAPLSSPEAGRVLHDRGIAYAPDTLVNVGAVAEGVLTWREDRSPEVLERVDAAIEGVRDRVLDVLETSRAEDVAPEEIVAWRWG